MGLLNDFRQYVSDAMPGGLLNPEWTPQRMQQAGGLMADFTPIVSGVKGAVENARDGNYGMAALNAATVPVDLATLGLGSALKGGLLGMAVSKPEGTQTIAKLLKELYQGKESIPVGTVESKHLEKWGKSGNENSLLFGSNDVSHTTKRLSEGLTPEEIAEIGFRATQKNAHSTVTGKGDLLLTSPIPMKFSDSPLFKPQAILREGDDGLHLYGVVPKGWSGRNK